MMSTKSHSPENDPEIYTSDQIYRDSLFTPQQIALLPHQHPRNRHKFEPKNFVYARLPKEERQRIQPQTIKILGIPRLLFGQVETLLEAEFQRKVNFQWEKYWSQNNVVRNGEITGIGFNYYHNSRIHFQMRDSTVMCFFLKQPNDADLEIYGGVYISRLLEPNIEPLKQLIAAEFGLRDGIQFQTLQIYPTNSQHEPPTHTGILHGPGVWLLEKLSIWLGSGAEVKFQILKQYVRRYEDKNQRWSHQKVIIDRALPNYQGRQIRYWNWLEEKSRHLTREQALHRDLYTPNKPRTYSNAPHNYRPPVDHFDRVSRRLRGNPRQQSRNYQPQPSFKGRPPSPEYWNQRVQRRQKKQDLYEKKGREVYGIANPPPLPLSSSSSDEQQPFKQQHQQLTSHSYQPQSTSASFPTEPDTQQQHQPKRQVTIVTTPTKPPQRTLTPPNQDIVGAIGLLLKTEHHATVETLKAGNATATKNAKSQHDRVTDQLSDMKQQIMSLQSASQKLIQAAQIINQRAYNIEQKLKTMHQTIHQNQFYIQENRVTIKNLPDCTNVLTKVQTGIKKICLNDQKQKIHNQHQMKSPSTRPSMYKQPDMDWLSPKQVITQNLSHSNDFMAPPKLQQQSPQQQPTSNMEMNTILTSPVNTARYRTTINSPRATLSPVEPPNFNFNVTSNRSLNQQEPTAIQEHNQQTNQQESMEPQQYFQQSLK